MSFSEQVTVRSPQENGQNVEAAAVLQDVDSEQKVDTDAIPPVGKYQVPNFEPTVLSQTEELCNKIQNLFLNHSLTKSSRDFTTLQQEKKVNSLPKNKFKYGIVFVPTVDSQRAEPLEQAQEAKINAKSIDFTPKEQLAGVSYGSDGIVAGSAPMLDSESKGHVMMEKMGWTTGKGLGSGTNKGILLPIQHKIKFDRAGLGKVSGEVSAQASGRSSGERSGEGSSEGSGQYSGEGSVEGSGEGSSEGSDEYSGEGSGGGSSEESVEDSDEGSGIFPNIGPGGLVDSYPGGSGWGGRWD